MSLHDDFMLEREQENLTTNEEKAKYQTGGIEISMQGLRYVLGTTNWVDFFIEEDQRIFLAYLDLL